MGVRTTDLTAVALYDSVTGTAFGPLFGNHDEANAFLEWLKEWADEDRGILFNDDRLLFVEDPRTYRDHELEFLVHKFREEA